jgi:hypothetical protein
MRGTGTTDADADMIVGEISLGQLAHVLVEGRREQEVTVVAVFVGIASTHDFGHLLFPVIMKQLISLIDDSVTAVVS